MEVHHIRECPENESDEAFLKFHFKQLARWTEKSINKNYSRVTLKSKYYNYSSNITATKEKVFSFCD